MVAIKSLAISSVCFLSMTGLSVQQFLSLGGALDNINWPVALTKMCNSYTEIIDINNNLLNMYYAARQYGCPEALRVEINKKYECPSGLTGYINALSWSTEFEKLQGQQKKIKAQASCLNFYATGRYSGY